jgi:hypothetical protein
MTPGAGSAWRPDSWILELLIIAQKDQCRTDAGLRFHWRADTTRSTRVTLRPMQDTVSSIRKSLQVARALRSQDDTQIGLAYSNDETSK